MIQFYAALQVLGAHVSNYFADQADTISRARDERGSVTIEQVLWAVAVIAIAVIVIGAIRTFVSSKSQEIKAP